MGTYRRIEDANSGQALFCHVASSDIQTAAVISYTFTGLAALGNKINKQAIEKMYERTLEDWQGAINHYLKTGNVQASLKPCRAQLTADGANRDL